MSADEAKKNSKTAAEQAQEVESQARAELDIGIYTHVFKVPVSYQGTNIDELTFNWGKLNGTDSLDIENALLMRGKTLITPEWTGDFLWGVAIRACTRLDEKGVRVLRADAAKSIPLRDFMLICKRARAFLLRAGS